MIASPAVSAGHSRPDDRRLLTVAKAQTPDGRFRIIKGPKDRACFRIDQCNGRALAESRRDFEVCLPPAGEGRKASLGCSTHALEGDVQSLRGTRRRRFVRPGERLTRKDRAASDEGADDSDPRAALASCQGSSPQKAPGKAPPSMRMFCPAMNPAWALARKAQSAPNSAGSPNRPTGIRAFKSARAVSTLTLR